jgi:hypothetical protein
MGTVRHPKGFLLFQSQYMDMAMRTEHERNRNQLTAGHSCAGVDHGLSARSPILPYKYCIGYSHSHVSVSKADSSVALDFNV